MKTKGKRARMRVIYDMPRKLMAELVHGVGFGIPVMHQGAFHVFSYASRWTDDPCAFAWNSSRRPASGHPGTWGSGVAGRGWAGRASGVDLGQAGKRAVRFSYAATEQNTPQSWNHPPPASSHQSQRVRLRCSTSVNAQESRTQTAWLLVHNSSPSRRPFARPRRADWTLDRA